MTELSAVQDMACDSAPSGLPADVSIADVLTRQEEERKELAKNAERMRSRIPRKDRIGRARVAEEFAEEERALAARHKLELAEISGSVAAENSAESQTSSSIIESRIPNAGGDIQDDLSESQIGSLIIGPVSHGKESRAARRRRYKAEAEHERDNRIAAEKAGMGPSERALETHAIEEILRPLGFAIHDVPPDGHCLYAAVAHQLKSIDYKFDDMREETDERGLSLLQREVYYLRSLTADHMLSHRPDYMPFLETVDCSDTKFNTYCERLRTEAVWGGQVELRAISQRLDVLIEVYSASMPLLVMGEDELPQSSPRLRLSFHQRYYDLGDHYNSVVRDEGNK